MVYVGNTRNTLLHDTSCDNRPILTQIESGDWRFDDYLQLKPLFTNTQIQLLTLQ